MEKLIYTIGEVAEMLQENVSLIRFWSDRFSNIVKPRRNAKGNRLYRMEDIQALKSVHYLVKTKGMTLEGAAAQLKVNRKLVDRNAEVLQRLTAIRNELKAVQKELENESL